MSLGLFEGLCPVAPEGIVGSFGCFVASWEIPLLLLLAAGVAALVWYLRTREEFDDGPDRLILPLGGSGGEGREGARFPRWGSDEEYERQREELRRTLSSIEMKPASPRAPPEPLEGKDPSPTDRMTFPAGAASSPGANSAGLAMDSEGGPPPPEGTLQLLPGRLEVVSGPGAGEEMRFVRVPGAKQELTLGRLEGPPHQHMRLDSPTVSRNHARLSYTDGVWTLKNESSTNPTIHNGRPLDSMVEEVPLHDGDRIEVGEVTLVFHGGTARGGLPQRSSWYTDRGRRTANQDAVVVRTLADGRELAVVCDGMGSHTESGVASHIALESLLGSLSAGAQLREAVEQANQAVLEAATAAPEREGMATTMVALLREGNHYEIANVGDSRAYRVTGDGIEQITRDHSFIAEAVEAGRMSLEEAKQSPWKTAITRSLGAEATVEVDMFPGFDVSEPATVLLCTDGVHGMLEAEVIADLVARTSDIRDVARVVAEEALLRGGEDNVAAAVLRFGKSETEASSG